MQSDFKYLLEHQYTTPRTEEVKFIQENTMVLIITHTYVMNQREGHLELYYNSIHIHEEENQEYIYKKVIYVIDRYDFRRKKTYATGTGAYAINSTLICVR